jgi:hypothetical protein
MSAVRIRATIARAFTDLRIMTAGMSSIADIKAVAAGAWIDLSIRMPVDKAHASQSAG